MSFSIKMGGCQKGEIRKKGRCLIFLTVLNIPAKGPFSLIIGAETAILDLTQVPKFKVFH